MAKKISHEPRVCLTLEIAAVESQRVEIGPDDAISTGGSVAISATTHFRSGPAATRVVDESIFAGQETISTRFNPAVSASVLRGNSLLPPAP